MVFEMLELQGKAKRAKWEEKQEGNEFCCKLKKENKEKKGCKQQD